MKEENRIEELLCKLNKGIVNNDQEFLECIIDLNERVKKLESKDWNEMWLNDGDNRIEWFYKVH